MNPPRPLRALAAASRRTPTLAAVALLLALPVAASAPEPLFDGTGRTRLSWPAAPAAPRAKAMAQRRQAAPAPPELIAAAARVGNAAMIARLAPAPAGASFSFGVIGDAEGGHFWWERTFSPGKTVFLEQWRALQASGAGFVLQLGDFVIEGTASQYSAHVELVEREAIKPLLRCIGNHDRSRPNGGADKTLYEAVFGARDYFFDHGGWRFVSLDSSDRVLTAAQLAWLEQALAPPGPKLVFTHVPPAYLRAVKPLAAVGGLESWSARSAARQEQRSYLQDFLTNYFEDGDTEFERLVRQGGVKAVYMGHIHAFWAADHRGVRYVISGGGGSPLYPLPPGYPSKRFAHALRVEARPDRLVETVLPYKGTEFTLPPVAP